MKLLPLHLSRFIAACMLLFCFSTAHAQAVNAENEIKNYLKTEMSLPENMVQSVFISKTYNDASTGIRHIYAHQKINGLTIIGSNFALHTTSLKKVPVNELVDLQKISVRPVSTSVDQRKAISIVFDAINYTYPSDLTLKTPASGVDKKTVFKRNESSIWDIPLRLVYVQKEMTNQLLPAWEVQMMDVYKKHYWVCYIDAASGEVLKKLDIMMHCDFGQPNTITDLKKNPMRTIKENVVNEHFNTVQFPDNIPQGAPAHNNRYRVFPLPFEHPNDDGASHLFVFNSGDALGSPDGWHQVFGLGAATTYPYTHGNNVWAFYDPSPGPLGGVPSADPDRTAYNNTLIGGLPSLVEPFKFNYPFYPNKEAETYRKAAIVNLFYWNNLMHDVYYRFGFTEEAGNFQESNIFSTGLRGSATENLALDEVLAQAQDGGGTNNANFLTLPDGVNGQMQMYLWTASVPDSLLQITGSSDPGQIQPGTKIFGVQGSFSNLPTANNNLHDSPVVNKPLVILIANQASTVGDETEGCSTGQQSIALPPSNNVRNKIALIDRGECSFVEKVLGAQEGGAVGAVIINNIDGPPLAMGGSDGPTNAITIPAIMISKADGDNLKSLLNNGVEIRGSLKRDNIPPPGRDGDVDNGVIAHEYGHGISSRLTGGGTGDALFPLGGDEQGGEGWSDFCALYMTLRNNDLKSSNADHPFGILPSRGIGNYVTYQPNDGPGIRPAPYSIYFEVNPLTFQNIDDGGEISIPHGVGSIWCEMMYEMLQSFIDKYGMNDDIYEGANPIMSNGSKVPNAKAKGNNIAMRLIIEAMKLQESSPTFVQQRNAILKADTLLYDGMHACLIWKSFAKRGLGYSALSNTNSVGDEVESFDVPLTCNPNQNRIEISKEGPHQIVNHDLVTYAITVSNLYNKPVNKVVVTDTIAAIYNLLGATGKPARNGKVLTWTTKLNPNQSKTYYVRVRAMAKQASKVLFEDTHEDGTGGWQTSNITATQGKWQLKTNNAQAFSGSNYWFAPNVGTGGSNTALTSTTSFMANLSTVLVFTHKYYTQGGYDGGIVEISEDNGATWTFLPNAKFISNGYNNMITTQRNNYIGALNRAAFSGKQSTYITSVASLEDYAGKKVMVRFRFTSDPSGGSEPDGGWWIDDVEVLNNKTDVENKVYAVTTPGDRVTLRIGSNPFNLTTAILIQDTANSPASFAREMPVADFKTQIAPNPASTSVIISLNNASAQKVTINLYDEMGKALATFNAGNNTNINLPISVSNLANGTYWVEIRTPDKIATYPLSVKH